MHYHGLRVRKTPFVESLARWRLQSLDLSHLSHLSDLSDLASLASLTTSLSRLVTRFT